jgi:hypothetical protein
MSGSSARHPCKTLVRSLSTLLACCLFFPAALVQSLPRNVSEEAAKAAFIYRFLNYVEWPASAFANADTPYVIGIVDSEDVANELKNIVARRKINGRAVTFKRLRSDDTLAGIHVLFIGKEEKSRQDAWIKAAQQQPVLIVTETDGALEQGSMINFVVADHRVRFEVNAVAIERAQLKANSRLLAVAIDVKKEAP